MARPLRIEFPNALYHVTSRGNAKQRIFMDDYDRRKFLKFLDLTVTRFHWLVHAYCLMDNHYHIVVETLDANLSRGMRHLNGEYAQFFNWWHDRIGHLFQARYKAILVDKSSYYLEVCRYVVLNPVRAHVALDPADWQWSSYHATSGKDKVIKNLSIDFLLSCFSSDHRTAVKAYQEFVNEGINQSSIWEDVKGQIILGNDDFVERICALLDCKRKDMIEIPRVQKYVGRPTLDEIFRDSMNLEKCFIKKLVHKSYHYGYTMQQIAEQLGVYYTTISRWLKEIKRD